MKFKKILLAVMAVLVAIVLTACTNQTVVGNRVTSGSDIQTFNYAYIDVGGKVIEGRITQWRDYTNSDVIQIRMDDGKYYLTHYSKAVLIYDPQLGYGYADTGLVDYN